MDAFKDYLTPKTFSIPAYVCLIAQFLCGVVVTSIVFALSDGEFAKFNCAVGPESAASYKTTVEKSCYSRYEEKYNSPLPFYAFVILSIGFPIFVGVVYSLSVRNRVKEISGSNRGSNNENQPLLQNDAEAGNEEHNRRSFYVFYFYFFHFVIRLLFGLVFTILQYAVFFRSGFDFEFSCDQPTSDATLKIAKNASQLNNTTSTITCKNSTASEKQLWAVIVCALNTIFAAIIFVEVIHLCRRFSKNLRFWSEDGHVHDTEFITVYFFQKRYTHVGFQQTTLECVDSYKRRVLAQSRTPDVIYGQKTGLDDLFIDVVIHTERARHNFRSNMDRHEIFDVYMKVPDNSIRLEKVKDLFYADKDTKGKRPRKILAVGRPGIGKTVLTEKIMRDWAKKNDAFYSGMIAFHFKFRWFNLTDWHHDNLKKFLRFGTRLNDEEFERIFYYLTKEPEKALLIFDGLDEFDGNIEDCLDHTARQNNPDICMPAISLFIKLISGHFLPGATILVTTRPTASDFYSRFTLDRTVEIIGFTSKKIEDYVRKFCENHDRSDLKPKMWKHIESSSDLLNLCYIPVNSFIVSTVLFGSLTDPRNETAVLPTTLTEVYQTALEHFHENHHRKTDEQSSVDAIKNLQSLAYNGILQGQLVFRKKLFDEEMRRSGLLNKLSNPIYPIQEQFCFIHLTVQEFFAAKHVTETQSPEEIKNFIRSNDKNGKWHLVLQFIAGILGQKIKTFREENQPIQLYKDCVLAFAKSFGVHFGNLYLAHYASLFVMKCLKEAGDEDIVKEACERTALKDVVSLSVSSLSQRLSSRDLAAVIYVCEHMKKLTDIHVVDIHWSEECYREICNFFQQRCMRELKLEKTDEHPAWPLGDLFKSLIKLKCTTLDHEHSKLTTLELQGLSTTDKCLSMILDFFKHGHASCLEELILKVCGITSSKITEICEVLDNKLCPELTTLELSGNDIRDEGVRVLCNALIKCHHLKLTTLVLHSCFLTNVCIPSLCELFKDEHCKLTDLDMGVNDGISDEGVKVLCNALIKCRQLKLTRLALFSCSLTDECIPSLCELLKDEHCKLTVLEIGHNSGISDEGVRMLCEDVLTNEHCKLAELNLDRCSLTDQCIPWLRKALLDKRCVITDLSIAENKFTEEGKASLRKLETYEVCKARGFRVHHAMAMPGILSGTLSRLQQMLCLNYVNRPLTSHNEN